MTKSEKCGVISGMKKVILAGFIALSLIAAALPAEASRLRTDSLTNAFVGIRTSTIWPVEGTGFDAIESAFGPRIKGSTDAYDWHRGVDIDADEGTNVLAATDGELWDVKEYADGGMTVILRHAFPKTVSYKNLRLTYYYTFYMHLHDVADDLVAEANAGTHPAVTAGQTIGQVGHTGTAEGDHLHFEMRVGSWCSLEYQLAHPTSSCAGFGFDPAMNPLWLFVPLTDTATLAISSGSNGDVTIRSASSGDQPLANRFEIGLYDRRAHRYVAWHELDFNRRVGFDATTNAALDTVDATKPYVSPISFGNSRTEYVTNVNVPAVWLNGLTSDRYEIRVTARDIWGRGVSTKYRLGA